MNAYGKQADNLPGHRRQVKLNHICSRPVAGPLKWALTPAVNTGREAPGKAGEVFVWP